MSSKKKENIDVHPGRVQNPFAKLKRSPGKFDQKVSRGGNDNDVRVLHKTSFNG